MPTITNYTFTKAPPVNNPVLVNQINADPNIGIQVVDLSYSDITQIVSIDMADVLTTNEQTELATVVANHIGIAKAFSVGFPQPLFDDFVTSNSSSALGWTSNTQNGGLLAMGSNATQTHPGVVHIGTGNLAIGLSAYHLGLSDVVPGGGDINMEFCLRVNQLGGALNNYAFRIGLGDVATGAFNNGVWIEYSFQTSANWLAKTASAATVTTLTSTIPVDTGWHVFSFNISADLSTATYFVDEGCIGQNTTNIPTTNVGPIIQLQKLLGTTPNNVDVDYFYFNQDTGRQ